MKIRFAEQKDTPTILALIKELAEFEKLLDEVVATEEILEQSLFGDSPKAEVLLAEVEDDCVGFALFFHNFSTFLGKPGLYLEDLYVKSSHRGSGAGLRLLKKVAEIANERNCDRLEGWVLNWNERAKKFYESLGAKPMSEWTVYRVSGESLSRFGVA